MTTDPKMPEPVYSVFVRGNLQDTLPYAPAWTLKEGVRTLITAAAQAYAEALAAARVAQERERWRALLEARAAGCERAAENTEDPKFDLMARVLMSVRKDGSVASNVRSSCQQPPETGKEKS